MGALVTADKDQQPAPEGADKVPDFHPRPASKPIDIVRKKGTQTQYDYVAEMTNAEERPRRGRQGNDQNVATHEIAQGNGNESKVSEHNWESAPRPGPRTTAINASYMKKYGIFPRSDGMTVPHQVCKCDHCEGNKPECAALPFGHDKKPTDIQKYVDSIKEREWRDRLRHGAFIVTKIETTEEAISSCTSTCSANPGTDCPHRGDESPVYYPRILLMGLPKSGKTSVHKKIFKCQEVKHVVKEDTDGIVKNDVFNFPKLKLQAWDVPWSKDLFDGSYHTWTLYRRAEAIIFVIDAQESEPHIIKALSSFLGVIKKAMSIQAPTRFDLFFHKVDLLTLGQKQELLTGIQALMSRWLTVAQLDHPSINYHLTSVKDNSVFESFSTVAQGVMPQLPVLQEMLNLFVKTHETDTALIADAGSWIIYASHSMPVDKELYILFQTKSKAILASKLPVSFFLLLDKRSLLLVIKLTDKMTFVSVLPKHRCDIFFEACVRHYTVVPKIEEQFGSAE